ncbi:winged helix-turn-helix transcriptional regulator [Gelidibacter algens]|uniref:winged helix-turn-helix transcriptional regulator n=1 Tax=Gelidibacter algens TaxID=49280 RepID=UPI001B805211
MKNRRITLKDLAQDLNLSASTISRALDNHPAISVSTKKNSSEKGRRVRIYSQFHRFQF